VSYVSVVLVSSAFLSLVPAAFVVPTVSASLNIPAKVCVPI